MNEKIDRVKKHLAENKTAYISAGVGLVVGAAGMYAMSNKSVATQKAIAIGWGNHQNLEQTTVLVRRGHPGNIIKCNETGEMFASVRRAAELLDLHRRDIFNHLHGLTPDVKGYTFTNLGEAV